MQFVLIKRDVVFLTVVHEINGSVPHTLLAPFANSLVVVKSKVAVVGADVGVSDHCSRSVPEGAMGALLGLGRCCANFCIAFLTVR